MMSDFKKMLKGFDFPITYEVPSPRGGNVDEYIEHIKNYDFLDEIIAFNVCNNPVGRVRIDPAPYGGRISDEIGVEVIAHLTCRDSTLGGLQRWLLGAQSLGIRTLLAMTGDYAVGDYPTEEHFDHINSLELITGIKEYLNKGKLMPELSTRQSRQRNRYLTKIEDIEEPTNFQVGGVIISQRANEATYAARKVEAGADFFQTQITYDSETFLNFLENFEEITKNHVPILVSTSPFSSKEEMIFLSETIPQVTIPDFLRDRLNRAEDFQKESMDHLVSMYREIRRGVKERGLSFKIGAHVIPLESEKQASELVRRLTDI